MGTDAIWVLGERVCRQKQVERVVSGIWLCKVKSQTPAKRRDRGESPARPMFNTGLKKWEAIHLQGNPLRTVTQSRGRGLNKGPPTGPRNRSLTF